METIIGLGGAGCRVASRFESYPQYNVLQMDVGLKEDFKNVWAERVAADPEEFEKSVGSLKRLSLKMWRATFCLWSPDAGMINDCILAHFGATKKVQIAHIVYLFRPWINR